MNVRAAPELKGNHSESTAKLRTAADNQGSAQGGMLSCVTFCKETEAGAIEAHILLDERSSASYLFVDKFGNLFPAKILAEHLARPDTINLVDADDAELSWSLEGNTFEFRSGISVSSEWTLPNEPTYFIASNADPKIPSEALIAEAILLDPLTGELPRLTTGVAYRFTLLLAVHRCSAKVVVSVLDTKGAVIWSENQPADLRRRGGRREEDFQKIIFDFIAPLNVGFLRISVQKGVSSKREGFVFYCKPTLQAHVTKSSGPPVRASVEALKLFQTIELPQLQIALLAPPDDLPLEFATSVQISVEGNLFRMPCSLQRVKKVEITKVKFDHNLVRISGCSLDGGDLSDVTLGVFVDGSLETEEVQPPTGAVFDITLPLSARCLDGTVKCVEVRQSQTHHVLWSGYEFVPAVITPWVALQKHAGVPLDHRLSPGESFHLKSFRGWAVRQASGGIAAADVPDLAVLHDELVGGFRRRRAYPGLSFPVDPAPIVSIVIPVNDKFEVTYFCLCGLLFSANLASFEVIIVDDGSCDQTTRVCDFVSGVTVVRHEAAHGFVVSCNDGAARAKGKYICFLNNDTEVTAGWLDELLDVFSNFSNVGLAGSKLLYPDGSLQEAGGIVWGSGNPWNVGRRQNASHPQFNYLRQVDYLSGAAILLPRSVWDEVKGFSPEFAPGYFEDTDLAMKVRATGRRVVYAPFSVVYHFEGQSSGTSTSAGMKRYQEINRPKFRQKWHHLYAGHAPEGHQPEREKDRGVSFRVLFVDHRYPTIDMDAGSYAAFQEMRMLQALGGKITCLPRNLAWMDRHTKALQRAGIECLYAPFTRDFSAYIRDHSGSYDAIYVNRYKLAEQVIEYLPKVNRPKVIFNLADLHFLRELRGAVAETPGYSVESAEATRAAELAVVRTADLTMSYSEVELAILESYSIPRSKLAQVPWVVDTDIHGSRSFDDTKDILFLGGFQHPPNVQAVKFFVREVGPLLRLRLPDAHFHIAGSAPTDEVLALESDWVTVHGYVADITDLFRRARIFAAPLLSGAGVKGKVLEGLSRGAVMVLSPVAAEGIGITDGNNCRIASGAEAWAASVADLYTDREEWCRLSENAKALARSKYSFDKGVDKMRAALASVDIFGSDGLSFRHPRPSYR